MGLNGILLVDKPEGWTSHDVIAKLRGVLHERRMGHSGTLDPMATGLLVVFLGRATRGVEFAENHEKEYLATMRLGISTDTQDITGNIINQSDPACDDNAIAAAVEGFVGEISQIPPMYSAIKVGGQKLYDIARRGGTAERQPRKITIHCLDILGRKNQDIKLRVRCSKGTYIRTLCSDIGDSLGCGAALSALRRTCCGEFKIENAHTIEEIISLAEKGEADKLILPLDEIFSQYDKIAINAQAEKKCRCGAVFSMDLPDGTYRLYSESGSFLALSRAEGGMVKTIKSFFEV